MYPIIIYVTDRIHSSELFTFHLYLISFVHMARIIYYKVISLNPFFYQRKISSFLKNIILALNKLIQLIQCKKNKIILFSRVFVIINVDNIHTTLKVLLGIRKK